MPDQAYDDDDLDLSPEVMCQLGRRRSRQAAMAASGASAADRADHSRS